ALEDGRYRLSEAQVKAILELRLHRLTQLGREEIGRELEELAGKIAEYLEILGSRDKLLAVLKAELEAVREKYADARRTEISTEELAEIDEEALIAREDMVVTVTHNGYIKRTPLAAYREQRRGGKGRAAMATRDEDVVTRVFVANTHQPILFFSSAGQVYKLKVWKLPLGAPQARGKALVNLLPLAEGETITSLMALPEDEAGWDELHVMFATRNGYVRRNRLSDFVNVPSVGKIAIRFEEGSDDQLVGVAVCREDQDVLLAARGGKCIRFPVSDVRVFKGRTAVGVRGMKLEKGDAVISLSILSGLHLDPDERDAYLKVAPWKSGEDRPDPAAVGLTPERVAELAAAEEFVLTVTENGYGKRSSAYEYRTTHRGGSGIVNIVTSARNGPVVASRLVRDGDQLLLVTDRGKMIRIPVSDIRIMGRATQGVTLFRIGEGERVVSVARIAEADADEDGEEAADEAAS
ncbi:MAG: DNA gyrase subunit A, partial [Alphaproteobacteria bacterium]